MRYSRVYIDALSYDLPLEVVSTHALEARLAPLYARLGLPDAQVELLTGVAERRFWPRGFDVTEGAVRAARKALQSAGCDGYDLDAVVYAGVCRAHLEPATACAVAAALGVPDTALVYDLSNACLGVLNGIVDLAMRIELGDIRSGLVVACESARDIVADSIERLLASNDRELFTASLATLTGGSGAAAVLLSDGSRPAPAASRHRLETAVWRNDVRRHELCRWGFRRSEQGTAQGGGEGSGPALYEHYMTTDGVAVLKHGVELGRKTWRAFLDESGWEPAGIARIIPHQIGRAHRQHMLNALELRPDQDFATFPYLGNIGTVSVPLTAAVAAERGALRPGDRTALLGIGSGLSSLMLGIQW